MFDEPVEHAVEWAFHKGFEIFGGHAAVADRPVTGQQDLRQAEAKARAIQEKKEL